jgi:hypothetical protein
MKAQTKVLAVDAVVVGDQVVTRTVKDTLRFGLVAGVVFVGLAHPVATICTVVASKVGFRFLRKRTENKLPTLEARAQKIKELRQRLKKVKTPAAVAVEGLPT